MSTPVEAQPTPENVTSDEELMASLSPTQREHLAGYIDALLIANAQFNLTAVRDRQEAWNRHVVESLRLTPLIQSPRNLLDVGSGGGLPGMILAISRPDILVSLLEATAKKAKFLEETSKSLGLKNVNVICERAEIAGAPTSRWRENFEVVTARAVAPLRTLLELTLPFLKINGTLMAIKGQKAELELAEADNAQKRLHSRLLKSVRQPSATVLLITKDMQTSKTYPRRSGEPKHNPL